jgi:hypothetical protein
VDSSLTLGSSPPLAGHQLRGIEHHVPDVQPHPRVRDVYIAVARLENRRSHAPSQRPLHYLNARTETYDDAAPE